MNTHRMLRHGNDCAYEEQQGSDVVATNVITTDRKLRRDVRHLEMHVRKGSLRRCN